MHMYSYIQKRVAVDHEFSLYETKMAKPFSSPRSSCIYLSFPTALSDFVFLKLIYPVYTLGYCSKGWHGQYDSELLCLI